MKSINEIINGLNTFTLSAYNDLLVYLKTKYNIVTFSEWDDTMSPKLVLRHDIDGHIKYAIKMSYIELNNRIKATYFISMSNRLFNPFWYNDLIQKLIGFYEIGLHFDNVFDAEMNGLKAIVSREINYFSVHNYSLKSSKQRFINDAFCAYNKKFMKCYVSDSKRTWQEDDLRELLEGQSEAQLLIHPFLYTEKPMTFDEWYDSFFADLKQDLDKYKQEWLMLWK